MANVNGVFVNTETGSEREVDLTDVYCTDNASKSVAIELKPNADDTDQTRKSNAAGQPDGLIDVSVSVSVDSLTGRYLIYGVTDPPPLHVTLVYGLQVDARVFGTLGETAAQLQGVNYIPVVFLRAVSHSLISRSKRLDIQFAFIVVLWM